MKTRSQSRRKLWLVATLAAVAILTGCESSSTDPGSALIPINNGGASQAQPKGFETGTVSGYTETGGTCRFTLHPQPAAQNRRPPAHASPIYTVDTSICAAAKGQNVHYVLQGDRARPKISLNYVIRYTELLKSGRQIGDPKGGCRLRERWQDGRGTHEDWFVNDQAHCDGYAKGKTVDVNYWTPFK